VLPSPGSSRPPCALSTQPRTSPTHHPPPLTWRRPGITPPARSGPNGGCGHSQGSECPETPRPNGVAQPAAAPCTAPPAAGRTAPVRVDPCLCALTELDACCAPARARLARRWPLPRRSMHPSRGAPSPNRPEGRRLHAAAASGGKVVSSKRAPPRGLILLMHASYMLRAAFKLPQPCFARGEQDAATQQTGLWQARDCGQSPACGCRPVLLPGHRRERSCLSECPSCAARHVARGLSWAHVVHVRIPACMPRLETSGGEKQGCRTSGCT
jgi:hypothetical protein